MPKTPDQLTAEIATLARAVADQSDAVLRSHGETLVLTAGLMALVESHPDPAAFAASFRRFWMQLGQQHSNSALDAQTQHGIDDMLANLEEACQARLLVRPDRS